MLHVRPLLRSAYNRRTLQPFTQSTAVILSALLSFAIVTCHDSVSAQEAKSRTMALSDLQQQWKTIDQSLDKVQQKLDSGEGDSDALRIQLSLIHI